MRPPTAVPPERSRTGAPSSGSSAPATTGRGAWPTWWLVVVCATTATVLLVAVLLATGGAPRPAPPPLPDAGPGTGWALPLSRLLTAGATVVSAGLLLNVAILLPGDAMPPPVRRRSARSAAGAAAVAAAAVLGQSVLTLSDLLALPVSQALETGLWAEFVVGTVPGRVLALQTLVWLVVALLALTARTAVEAGAALAAAAVAAVLPALAGHSAAEQDHVLAVVSLGVHLLAATLWVGGLAALTLPAFIVPAEFAEAVRRYSFLALGCAVAVVLSGVLNASLRVGEPALVLHSGYGMVLLVKAGVFAVLVALGWVHRRRTVPRFAPDAAGSTVEGGPLARRSFARLAAVELLVMAGTYGVAVGLSRTPPPAGQEPLLTGRTPADALLGYPLPEAPTLGGLLGAWHPDAFGLLFAALAAALYLTGVRVLWRRGDAWPRHRTAAWSAGVLAVLVVTCTGVGRYAPAMFSVHMVQHMTLNMIAPLLLVLGAPITLALRALPARDRRGLLAVLRSRPARFAGHPVVVTGIFVGSLYVLYFTPLFEAAMRNHWGHLLMQGHFLASGFLFFWMILGIDPDPGRPAHLLRVPLLLAVVLAHTVFAVVLVFGATVIGDAYYTQLSHPWAVPLLDDQALGGAIAWVLGELTTVGVLAAVVLQWFATAERADRAATRAGSRRSSAL